MDAVTKDFVLFCNEKLIELEKKGEPSEEAFGKALCVSYVFITQKYAVNGNLTVQQNEALFNGMEICALASPCKDIHSVPSKEFQTVLKVVETDLLMAREDMQEKQREQKAGATLAQIASEVQTAQNEGSAQYQPSYEHRLSNIEKIIADARLDDNNDTDFEQSFETLLAQTAKERDGFIPATFAETYVSFPDGTISFIGAPTSRGKTAAMASMAIDALIDNAERRVLFLSLEEAPRQILRRLVMCLAYRTATKDGAEGDREELIQAGNDNPICAWKLYVKMHEKAEGSEHYTFNSAWMSYIPSALEQVIAWQKNGRIAICNGDGRLLNKLIARASQMRAGDIIFYDYIQRLPGGIVSRGDNDMRFIVQGINDNLLRIVKKNNAILIAGAQFNRTGGKAAAKQKEAWQEVGDDNLDDTLFAECGGIEKDAHIAIGIGGNNTDEHKGRHFVKVLKNREGEKGGVYNLDFCGAYSYLKATGKMTAESGGGSAEQDGKEWHNPTKAERKAAADKIIAETRARQAKQRGLDYEQ